jgi:hypothetical protein
VNENKEDQKELERHIERIVSEKRCSHLDAIVIHCENTGLEIEVAAKLVGRTLKKKLKEEAIRLNLYRETVKSGKLPI